MKGIRYMSLAIKKKKWTYQEYEKLEDEKRYEIIKGELLMVPSPSWEHQEISGELGFIIQQYVKEKKLGKVFYAPLDVALDTENLVQPDIGFISNKNQSIIKKKGIFGTPDLLIEILSPSSIYRDRYEKKDLYERFKVKEYWLVDPINKTIEVFALEEKGYQLLSFADLTKDHSKVRSKIMEGLEIDVEKIAGFLQE